MSCEELGGFIILFLTVHSIWIFLCFPCEKRTDWVLGMAHGETFFLQRLH